MIKPHLHGSCADGAYPVYADDLSCRFGLLKNIDQIFGLSSFGIVLSGDGSFTELSYTALGGMVNIEEQRILLHDRLFTVGSEVIEP